MKIPRPASRILAAALIALIWPGHLLAQSLESEPVKVEVSLAGSYVKIGDPMTFEVILKDIKGAPTIASKPMTIQVQSTTASGATETTFLTIEPGEVSAVGTLVIQEAGPISIKTSQPELLQGGAIVFGVPGGTAEGQSLQIQSNQPRPAQVPATRGITLSPPEGETALDELGGQISGASPEMAVSDAPTTLGGSDLALKILHNVDRHIRAGDNDAVTVYAYLQGNGRSALGEVQVHLQPSLGKLEPNPLVIPAGELFGKARFSSEVAGESILRFVGSIPNLPLQDASEISVRFEPPIWNLRLAVSPPEISIIETASIVGELLDQDGVPTATDKTLRMSLKIQEGRGEIVPLDIVFNKGESTARAKFQPTEVGNVVISGSLPSLLAREGSLLVVIPWVTGILSLLGGGIGGTIAFLRQRKKWWRILIGVVTGVMIYWAAVFGFVDELTPGVALNPVTALVVSILGGIAGTGVITWMLKLFGLRAA